MNRPVESRARRDKVVHKVVRRERMTGRVSGVARVMKGRATHQTSPGERLAALRC